jgi:putative addiction module component (TIGR02574 family)
MIRLVTTDEIVSAALKLDRKERAYLASQLIQSLDVEEEKLSPEEWERLWAQEIDRRMEELRQGKVNAVPGEEVFARARAILSS